MRWPQERQESWAEQESLGLQLVRRRSPAGKAGIEEAGQKQQSSTPQGAKGPHSVLGVGLQGTNVGQRGRVLR